MGFLRRGLTRLPAWLVDPLAAALLLAGAGGALLTGARDVLPVLVVAAAALVGSSWWAAGTALVVAAAAVAGASGLGALAVAGLLGAALHHARRRNRADLAQARAALADAAVEDALTGLPNRRAACLLAGRLLPLARRGGWLVSVSLVDVDGLGQINAEQGRASGDLALAAVAAALRRCCRSSDVVARWDGAEIVVLSVGGQPDPAVLTDRVASELIADVDLHLQVAVSVGTATAVAWELRDLAALDELVDAARQAMTARRAARPSTGRR